MRTRETLINVLCSIPMPEEGSIIAHERAERGLLMTVGEMMRKGKVPSAALELLDNLWNATSHIENISPHYNELAFQALYTIKRIVPSMVHASVEDGKRCPKCGNWRVDQMAKATEFIDGRNVVVGTQCMECGFIERDTEHGN